MKKVIILIAILVPTMALLYFSLTRDPRTLPSALVEKPAPDFTLRSLDGETVALHEARGKPVVLSFWSTWCGPCAAEHVLVREAVENWKNSDVKFFSVLYEDTPEAAKAFVAEHGKAAPILLDPDLKTAMDYGVSGVPETFFIDRRGKVALKQVGMLTPEILEKEIPTLIQERAP